jgi:hypothetical protein
MLYAEAWENYTNQRANIIRYNILKPIEQNFNRILTVLKADRIKYQNKLHKVQKL